MGPHTQNDLSHIQIARFLVHLQPGSQTIRNIVSKSSEHLNGRQLAVQCGRCVGGASAINFGMYTRASGPDYDTWASLYDNPGWSFAELLPLIKKAETYQNAPDRPTHGYSGPLKVSRGVETNVGKDYLDMIKIFDKSREIVDDASSMDNDVNRYESWSKWLDETTGHRSDVAHSYIYNTLASSDNFHVLANCSVKRVLIENGKAIGVEYFNNQPTPANNIGTPRTVYAKKLVVLAAGTFGSPAILERSGIGAKDILAGNGVEQVVDLPGVGENDNDHPLLFVPFNAKDDSEILDGIVRNNTRELEKWSARWTEDGKGLMSTNGIDGGIKFRPTDEELCAIGPDVHDRWQSFFAPSPHKPIFWSGVIAQYVGPHPPGSDHKCYCTGGFMTYPASTGYVHITSADDPEAPPEFDSGVFSCKEDLAMMRYLYKRGREQGRRMTSFRGEYAADHPKFPAGSQAAVCEGPALPIDMDAPPITYTEQDNQAIDDLLKANTITAWHSLGTCAMKPREASGVVNSRLDVYGVENLKVADMSICPSNIATNTYSTAVMIGEKAAVLIGEELGIMNV